jgi:hypothetical protein
MNSNCDGGLGHSTPITGIFWTVARVPPVCHTAAPPSAAMNSRRLYNL